MYSQIIIYPKINTDRVIRTKTRSTFELRLFCNFTFSCVVIVKLELKLNIKKIKIIPVVLKIIFVNRDKNRNEIINVVLATN